jgi:hypothetical protein
LSSSGAFESTVRSLRRGSIHTVCTIVHKLLHISPITTTPIMSACISYGSVSTSIRAKGSEQLLHPPVAHQRSSDGDDDDDTDNDSQESVDQLRDELLHRAKQFDLPVSPEKGYRATQLNIFSFRDRT